VKTATAVEATTMALASAKGMPATESAIGMGVSVYIAPAFTMLEPLMSVGISAMIVPIPVPVPAIVVPVTATIPATIPEPRGMAPVIPRARSNEDTVYEILRPVVAVGSACIRIIVVIAIGADWRASNVRRPYSDSNSHSNLRLRIRKRHHQDGQQREIFHVTHTHLRLLVPSFSFLVGLQKFFDLSIYWNSDGGKKFREPGWLISAIPLKFNHLRRS
jgi:hypothetical protein